MSTYGASCLTHGLERWRVEAAAQRDMKEHVMPCPSCSTSTDAEQDDLRVLAELAEAARGYAGCERPQFVSEGEMAECGACWG